jgi:hypothetical protein
MADRVQPPEGLRKIAAEALAKFWNESIANIGEPVETLYHSDDAQESADAVLAALFDACEVRERWGTRFSGSTADDVYGWWPSRSTAEAVTSAPSRIGSTKTLVRRCELQTPPEINT